MSAWVRDDQKTYTAYLPLEHVAGEDTNVTKFKNFMEVAARLGYVERSVVTATVFGGAGSGFTIPKEYLRLLNIVPDTTLDKIPSELPLTRGTNQKFVFAAVPQLEIGTYKHTQALIRYIPPVEFDTAVGDFSFVGVALKHGFTNWMKDPPFHAAVQVSYQHSTINNKVGDTQAELDAVTDMWSVNVHASRRFELLKSLAFEPYIGVSYENLRSTGTYTFVLPKRLSDELEYDIDPQTAHVDLSDNALKATIGFTVHVDPVEFNVGAGISKHFILGAGLGVRFDPPFMDQEEAPARDF
jgi:hypothetical protein